MRVWTPSLPATVRAKKPTGKPNAEPDQSVRRCFMITPIGVAGSTTLKHADWVFRFLKAECDDRSITLERADKMSGSPMITSRIFEALSTAEFCVADLTGLNANVFYELGVRHSFRLPVIHIAHVGTELPFDNAQHDTAFFDLSDCLSMEELSSTVGRQLDIKVDSDHPVSNPLTQALGSIEVSKSGDSSDQVIGQLLERVASLERTQRSQVTSDKIDALKRRTQKQFEALDYRWLALSDDDLKRIASHDPATPVDPDLLARFRELFPERGDEP